MTSTALGPRYIMAALLPALLLSGFTAAGQDPSGASSGAASNPSIRSPGNVPLTRQLMMSSVYVKEARDQAWQVRIVGDLPRGPGIHLLVYNETGELLHRESVPFGSFPAERPHIITVPADGKAQQYAIKFLGQQDNLNGIIMPLTNLPYEVYGDSGYMIAPPRTTGQRSLVAFQVTDTNPSPHFDGWRANYRILDSDGHVVADSKDRLLPMGDPAKKGDERHVEMIVTGLTPGKTYWIDPYEIAYINIRSGKLYLTFDPERWFEPRLDWTLQDRPWWKGVVRDE